MAEDDLETDWSSLRTPEALEETVVIAESIPEPRPVPMEPPPQPRPRTRTPLGEIIMNFLWSFLGWVVVAGIIAWLGWILYASVRADGHIEACYVEHGYSTYYVRGRIQWRDDPTLGEFPTLDEALVGKKKLCP